MPTCCGYKFVQKYLRKSDEAYCISQRSVLIYLDDYKSDLEQKSRLKIDQVMRGYSHR